MIVAISRFAVKDGQEGEVRASFEGRPRRAEAWPGFLGLEVFQDGPRFVLLTRWCDADAFRAWHGSSEHRASHAFMPAGLKLTPAMTELIVVMRPEMRILFISGYTEDAIVHHGVLDAGIAFLAKPILPGALVKAVRRSLDGDPRRNSISPR